GGRSRLQITDMMPAAKGWAKLLVHNFESCSSGGRDDCVEY
ncbi:hypothetical protein A2U01_0111451, partial [Trifolium medium]|nr:hypothetical protein [Trifolium medium]